MNIDWSKAPEDATHKDPDTDCFYRLVKDVWHLVCDDGESCVSSSLYNGETNPSDLIERPKKQEAWNGEGLPPVGTLCDMHIDDFGWITGTVVVHIDLDEPTAVAHNGEEVFHGNASDFRPIKTAEQLAEEEKVTAIAEMRAVVMAASGCTVATISECLATVALYEAGYRKQ